MTTHKLAVLAISTAFIPSSALAVGYVKIGDIKGESTESQQQSSVNVQIQTTTTTSTSSSNTSVRVEQKVNSGDDSDREDESSDDSGTNRACTADAKICPDGSVVGRDGNNNCEFFSCPGEVEDKADNSDDDTGTGSTEKKGNVEYEWKVEEGESAAPNDDKGGKVDVQWKVEKGEKSNDGNPDRPLTTGNVPTDDAKKPKEIVVVGSKVEQYNESDLNFILKRASHTEEELEEFANATAQADENIEELSLNFEKIKMKYDHPAKLFGFLQVKMPVETEVTIRGWDPENKPDLTERVKVQFPWWSLLATKGVDDFKTPIEDALSSLGDDAQMGNESLQEMLQKQQQTLQIISNVSKMLHDTAMSVIRKIGG